MTRDGYLLDNAAPAAGARLDALAEIFDPSTFRHIEALGIAPCRRARRSSRGPSSTSAIG